MLQPPNEPPAPAPIIGVEALCAALKTVPNAPGCYQMIDGAGRILYVGKAKNLANRVTSYTNINNLNNRILRMVNQIARVEILVAKNEAEALLLEASLIKKHQPRYNVLLKDDKSFPYIRVDTTHPFPRIEKHRGAQNKAGEYFGPFANVLALNQAMGLLQKIFLLRPCADSIFANRSRPCLQYQIKRCTAPCVGYVSEAQYAEQLGRARAFLKGKSREVQEQLTVEMNEASGAMDYEKAALLRDRIRALTTVQQEQGLRVAGLHDADVIALARRGDKSVVQVFFYRNGAPFGNQAFYPRHAADASDEEVLLGFLGQFYQAHLPPGEILLVFKQEYSVHGDTNSDAGEPSPLAGEGRVQRGVRGGDDYLPDFDTPSPNPLPQGERASSSAPEGILSYDLAVLSDALSARAERKVQVRVPERGDKRVLVEQAMKNAQGVLARIEMERASVESHLLKLKELFDLPHMPRRIEVYDNSHISGTHAVGGFIVATPEGFDKKAYRTFNIKDAATEPGDDYAMMREVMRRRFKGVARAPLPVASGGSGVRSASEPEGQGSASIASEGGVSPPLESCFPDLVLIDGGIGQLHAVEEALASIGVAGLHLVAIAKGADRNAGREWFHIAGRDPFQLAVNDPTLHYLQRLRDEAHRFAIGRHRNKRSKSFTQSALDDIPGIGPTRKKALLQHFGSRADVETATLEELQKVKGISRSTAQAIYDYFHG